MFISTHKDTAISHSVSSFRCKIEIEQKLAVSKHMIGLFQVLDTGVCQTPYSSVIILNLQTFSTHNSFSNLDRRNISCTVRSMFNKFKHIQGSGARALYRRGARAGALYGGQPGPGSR